MLQIALQFLLIQAGTPIYAMRTAKTDKSRPTFRLAREEAALSINQVVELMERERMDSIAQ